MKQIKYFMTDEKANDWIKENPDKEIIDIKFSAGGFAVIYEILLLKKHHICECGCYIHDVDYTNEGVILTCKNCGYQGSF